MCKVVTYNNQQTTCSCSNVGKYTTTATANSIFLDVSALSQQVLSDFISTLLVSRTLSLAVIAKNIVVFVTLGKHV